MAMFNKNSIHRIDTNILYNRLKLKVYEEVKQEIRDDCKEVFKDIKEELKNEIKEEFKGEIERLNTRIDLLKDVVDKYIIFVMD